MKSKNRSPYFIALTVIACSLALLAALTFALSGYQWGPRGRTLEIDFKDATGIKLHSSVRYAGTVAGTVARIRYLTPAERTQPGAGDFVVRITLHLNKEVPPLPSDVRASLSSETMLGEKFVALSAGTPGAPPLRDDAVIQGQSPSGIDSLTQTLQQTATAATELLERFSGDYPDLKTNLNQLLINGATLLANATNLVGDAQAAIADVRTAVQRVDRTVAGVGPQASNLLAETTSAATNLNRTIENTRAITAEVRQFLTNQFLVNLDENMSRLTSVLARVEVFSEYAKILAGNLAEKPSRLIWQSRANKLPSEEEIRQRTPRPPPASRR